VQVAQGRHTVCAYAINTGYGDKNPLLGCKTVTVAPAAWNPFGRFDGVSVTGQVATVSGWALDPDSLAIPVRVHVYVDGKARVAVTADRTRTDIGRLYTGAGSAHGFSARVALDPGRHTVCVYAINTGNGSGNPVVGCRTVLA
jgi:hypothetical protein